MASGKSLSLREITVPEPVLVDPDARDRNGVGYSEAHGLNLLKARRVVVPRWHRRKGVSFKDEHDRALPLVRLLGKRNGRRRQSAPEAIQRIARNDRRATEQP